MGFGDTAHTRKIPGVKFVAAADLYDGRLTHTKELFGNDVFTTRDYREILARADVDAVIIATPDHWHVPMAREALAAGKAVYLEKPAIHRVQEGAALVDAAAASGKVLQVGSQRVSSIVYDKARELYESGILGSLNMIEAKLNRNSAMGAWQYTIPPDASPETVDWDRFLGSAPKRPFDAVRFFRWRNYWDYGTGLGGDLFVHLFSGIHHILTSPGPNRIMTTGGLRFWKDGRDTPDVMMGLFDYPESKTHPAFTLSLQVNFADGSGGDEAFRFVGDEGVMTVRNDGLTVVRRPRQPITENEVLRGWNSGRTFSNAIQGQIMREMRAKPAQAPIPIPSDIEFKAPEGYDDQFDHFTNFFASMREGKPVVEDAAFGVRAAAPAVLSNTSYIEKRIINWDPDAMKMAS